SQNITCICWRVVRGDQMSKELFRIFAGEMLPMSHRLIARFPEREWLNIFVPVRPGFFAQIFWAMPVGIVKKQSIEIFARHKTPLCHRTCIGAMPDRPFIWE